MFSAGGHPRIHLQGCTPDSVSIGRYYGGFKPRESLSVATFEAMSELQRTPTLGPWVC